MTFPNAHFYMHIIMGAARLLPIATDCLFSRAWHRLPVFPRLAPVASVVPHLVQL